MTARVDKLVILLARRQDVYLTAKDMQKRSSSYLFPGVALALFAGVLVVAGPSTRGTLNSPFVSSEIEYVSYSPLGLLGGGVIPASCESGFEHFPGECAGPYAQAAYYAQGAYPPPPPSVDLKVNGSDGPLTFEAVASYTAAWTSSGAASCVASGSWSGAKPISGSQGFSDIPRGTYNYTLTCSNAGGSTPDSVTVNVINVPQCTFAPSPASVILPQTSTLSWSCSFANSCAIDQGIGAVNPVSGSREVQPQQTTTYTLTCQGDDGPRSFPGTVRVFSPSLREILPR